jgi:excisionase family DNA binding protein
MKKQTENPIEQPLSTKQAAAILGISEKSISRMAETGELPAYRIGRLLKFKRSEVQSYFDAHHIKPEQKEEKEHAI